MAASSHPGPPVPASALSRTLARVRTRAGWLPDDTICSSRRRWSGVSRTTYLSLRATGFLLSGGDEEDTKRQISCNELLALVFDKPLRAAALARSDRGGYVG